MQARLRNCSSGRELEARGFVDDVEIAAEFDVSEDVPVLVDDAFVAKAGSNVADPTEVGQDERFKDGGSIRRSKKSSLADFVWNAFHQIPNLFSVIAFTFTERLWLIILSACLEAGALGLGYAMSKID